VLTIYSLILFRVEDDVASYRVIYDQLLDEVWHSVEIELCFHVVSNVQLGILVTNVSVYFVTTSAQTGWFTIRVVSGCFLHDFCVGHDFTGLSLPFNFRGKNC
jgi:hypothetical protein